MERDKEIVRGWKFNERATRRVEGESEKKEDT